MPYPKAPLKLLVEEFGVAIGGGVWVAAGATEDMELARKSNIRAVTLPFLSFNGFNFVAASYLPASERTLNN